MSTKQTIHVFTASFKLFIFGLFLNKLFIIKIFLTPEWVDGMSHHGGHEVVWMSDLVFRILVWVVEMSGSVVEMSGWVVEMSGWVVGMPV